MSIACGTNDSKSCLQEYESDYDNENMPTFDSQHSSPKDAKEKQKKKRSRAKNHKSKLMDGQGENVISSKTKKQNSKEQNKSNFSEVRSIFDCEEIKENVFLENMPPSTSQQTFYNPQQPSTSNQRFYNPREASISQQIFNNQVQSMPYAFHNLKLHFQDTNSLASKLNCMQTLPQQITPAPWCSFSSSEEDKIWSKSVDVLNFREMPIFPSHDELATNATPYLQVNIIKGQFTNVEHYLSIQFRLMREDLIRPLRNDIEQCKSLRLRRSSPLNPSNLRVFNVQIGNTQHSEWAIVTLVRFKTDDFKDFDWEASKLLTGGSLVCLTHNNFKSFTLATVAYSNPESLEKGEVRIKIENPDEDFLFYSHLKPYVMIEATSFFEAYRYVLKGLKEFSEDHFPFKEYIVYAHNVSSPPKYLRKDPNCDFSCILPQESKNSQKINVLNPTAWPKQEDLRLDAAQFEALQAAITEEFAIIQGPPGTGKTFIGLKLIKLMLNSNFPKPILVVAFTNHALDQFLEGISLFTNKLARVGGGSNSKILEVFQLKNLKEDFKKDTKLPKGLYKTLRIQRERLAIARDQIKELENEIKSAFESLIPFESLKNSISHKHSMYFKSDRDVEHWLNIKPSTKASQIQNGLMNNDRLTCEKEDAISNVLNLLPKDRWALYAAWLFRHILCKLSALREHKQSLISLAENIKSLKEMEDVFILKKMDVIGITTTGASKYKSIIDKLGSRIVIIEEAAEVLEAHIVTSLPSSIQHLILIGDHQQLKPRTSVYQLSKDYKLDISLFERMVRNNMKCHRLVTQHRMRPDISKLLVPDIYKTLENAPSVYNYEAIKGIKKNIFFISHTKLEHQSIHDPSYANYYEASFLFELCLFLRDQGYKASQMTILVTYTNQKTLFDKLIEDAGLPESFSEALRVTTVDGYQGEENDIILLSLVRSNEEGNIGFLSIPNRVCVALSRARKGLYGIGNFKILGRKCKLWKNILDKLQEKNCLGPKLPICCTLHPNSEILVGEPDDFCKTCEATCSIQLDCGHLCAQKCHLFSDPEHTYYLCPKVCNKVICQNNHRCRLKCHQRCEPCQVEVSKVMPKCGHIIKVPCSFDTSQAVCTFSSPKKIKCGHVAQVTCSSHYVYCHVCKREVCTSKKAQCHLT